MKRRQPSVSPEQVQDLWSAPTAAGESVTVQCQLVTPMYGGGVTAGQVDKAMPIRASGIRGQLRFWWRLLYRGDRDSKELFEKECELWGGIASSGPVASQVAVRVVCNPADDGQLMQARSPEVPRYSLISDPGAKPPMLLKHGYPFELKLTCDDEKRAQIMEVLRWWTSFGGVGARTRRGFGAIRTVDGGPDLKPVASDEIQRLGGRIVVGPQADALASWRQSIDALQTFRQVPTGRPGGKKPGRSNWPEADTIRRSVGQAARGHDPQIDVNRFPRAAFGLPIVFHFKDLGDPPDVILSPSAKDSDRMASPLVLRPYVDGQRCRPMAMLLPGWRECVGVPVGLHETKGQRAIPIAGGAEGAWPSDAAEGRRLASRLKPMRGESDPLTAFMGHFDERVNGRQRH